MPQTETDEPMFIIVIGTVEPIILVVMIGDVGNALLAPIFAAERPATVSISSKMGLSLGVILVSLTPFSTVASP